MSWRYTKQEWHDIRDKRTYWQSRFKEGVICTLGKAEDLFKLQDGCTNLAQVKENVELVKFFADVALQAAEKLDQMNQEEK